jgi:tetratricopeptide (TPR) repeat protein
MKKLGSLTLFLWTAGSAMGQVGGGHTLFGDFKVEDRSGQPRPGNYFLILFDTQAGLPVAREPVSNNGRYRFLNLRNGDYYISVELEGEEVARVPVVLADLRKTDIRKDIVMEWREGAGRGTRQPPTSYKRSEANNKLFEGAQQAVLAKKWDKAIPLLQQLLETDPSDFEARTELGTAYVGKQDNAAAEQAYERALAEKPTFLPALVNLGKLRMIQNKYEAAIEILGRAVESHPLSAESHYLLGECFLQSKKGSKAVVHLTEALRIDPVAYADAHLRLAALYNAAGLRDRAAAEYEQFLKKKPDHPEKEKLKKYIAENGKR